MRYKLGDLVELVTETNSELKYGLDDIVGVTLEKQMIPTIANLTQTDLDSFIVVRPKDFVYNPRTHGKKIGLGFNTTDRCFISTWNNNTFRVKPSMSNVIIPDYLYMHFLRERWDKEACFNAWGSSTVVLLWSSFCNMAINVPSIDEQRKTVHAYQVINNRISLLQAINENLGEYLDCIYCKLIQDVEETVPLSSICSYVTDKAKFSELENPIYLSTENLLPDKQGVASFGETLNDERVTVFHRSDVLVSNIRPYFKKMWFATCGGGCNSDVLCFRAADQQYSYILKSVLYQDSFYDYVMSGSKGTKMPRGDKNHIMQYPVPKLVPDMLERFNNLAHSIEQTQAQNRDEIAALLRLQDLFLKLLSR